MKVRPADSAGAFLVELLVSVYIVFAEDFFRLQVLLAVGEGEESSWAFAKSTVACIAIEDNVVFQCFFNFVDLLRIVHVVVLPEFWAQVGRSFDNFIDASLYNSALE